MRTDARNKDPHFTSALVTSRLAGGHKSINDVIDVTRSTSTMFSTPVKGRHPLPHAVTPTSGLYPSPNPVTSTPRPRVPGIPSPGPWTPIASVARAEKVNSKPRPHSAKGQLQNSHSRQYSMTEETRSDLATDVWRTRPPGSNNTGLNTSWLQGATPSTDKRQQDGVLPVGIGGWTPPKRVAPLHQEGVNQEQQLNAYIAWVNSQLKRKPGTRLVDDLRHDMKDGVALIHLIQVVAGETLTGVYLVPSNVQEMRENVQRVLQFMSARRIRMHHITAKDIVDGNLKSIMRLILALAAHFKPSSVKHHSSSTAALQTPSITSIAQGAAAALADARCDAASVGQRLRRPHSSYTSSPRETRFYGSGADSDHSGGSDHSAQRSYYDASQLDGVYSSASDTHVITLQKTHDAVPRSKSQDFHLAGGVSAGSADENQSSQISADAWNRLLDDHNAALSELHLTRKTLLQLQDLLLGNGLLEKEGDSDGESVIPFEGSSPEEDVVILRSRLQHCGEVCNDLREELSQHRNELMQLQGTKAGLQKRLSEQEEAFLTLKAELLRVGFTQQTIESEKVELQRKLSEKEKLVMELKKDSVQKDRQLEDLANELRRHLHDQDDAAYSMRSQIESLHERLCRAGDAESNLSSLVASQDRKVQRLEGKLLSGDSSASRPLVASGESTGSRTPSLRSATSVSSEELQVVRDSLRNLRSSLGGADAHQQVSMDTLEQSIASLMDKLQLTQQNRPIERRNGTDTPSRRVNYDSTGDIRRSPITALHNFPAGGLDADDASVPQSMVSAVSQQNTKVLYFTDRTVTPFMCTIPKRLGEIRLLDLKQIFDRSGNYRYHFKAMDPEFGTVKEEISCDEAIIPGWEGKIVAWIEEDHG